MALLPYGWEAHALRLATRLSPCWKTLMGGNAPVPAVAPLSQSLHRGVARRRQGQSGNHRTESPTPSPFRQTTRAALRSPLMASRRINRSGIVPDSGTCTGRRSAIGCE